MKEKKKTYTCLVRNYFGGKPDEFLSSSFFANKDSAIEYAERMMGIVRVVETGGEVVWERKEEI